MWIIAGLQVRGPWEPLKRPVLRSIPREAHSSVAQNPSTSNQLSCLQVPWFPIPCAGQLDYTGCHKTELTGIPEIPELSLIHYVRRARVMALASCESFRDVDATEVAYCLLIELADP